MMAAIDPLTEAPASPEKKAMEFFDIAEGIFSPIYPVIASQLLHAWKPGFAHRLPQYQGRCLDLGSAAGHLGIAIARQTRMEVTLLDTNPYALALSGRLLDGRPEADRISTVQACATAIPFGEEIYDLVVSRGSLWFWPDRAQAFREIWRVLRPGGLAYIGGGFGTAQLAAQIRTAMEARNGDSWPERQKKIRGDTTNENLVAMLDSLGLPYQIRDDETGLWVIIRKN